METVCLTYASAPAGENFAHKGIQNRLVFKTKIQNISRYVKHFLKYLENVLGCLDFFFENFRCKVKWKLFYDAKTMFKPTL